MSAPSSSRCVAKQWRKVWQEAGFVDACGLNGALDAALYRFQIDVVATPRARSWVMRRARSREHVLPAELKMCPRVFAIERIRKLYTRIAVRSGVLMALSYPLQLLAQMNAQHLWQHRRPVLRALAIAHENSLAFKVEILDSQAQRLQHSKAAAVEQTCNEQKLPTSVRQGRGEPRRDSTPLAAALAAWLVPHCRAKASPHSAHFCTETARRPTPEPEWPRPRAFQLQDV